MESEVIEGVLLLDKPEGKTSFYLVHRLRKITKVKKIGHAGTLDPFATGLMVLLIGKNFTRKSDLFLNNEKSYLTTLVLGHTTPSFDSETAQTFVSDKIPSLEEIQNVIASFQGELLQTPPMFSAKKVDGTPLYELARKGISIDRKPCKVTVSIEFISYNYPELSLKVTCSKGTYIRSLGHDIGIALGTGAYLSKLRRLSSGLFHLDQATPLSQIENNPFILQDKLIKDLRCF